MSTSIVEYMNQDVVKTNIQKTLGLKTGQFIATVASLYNSNEKLQECDQKSVMLACLTATSLDLPINQNLGFAFIIPYKKSWKNDRDEWENMMLAQFQIGYKGFIQLAQRSGQFRTINVTDVREGEIESMDRMTGEIKFKWLSDGRSKAKIIGYVGYMELINGFSKALYMTHEELDFHGKQFSQTYKKDFGLWKDNFDAMASKTVIKLLLAKYAPLTVEMQKAQLADQSIVKGEDDFEYVDNSNKLKDLLPNPKSQEYKDSVAANLDVKATKSADGEGLNSTPVETTGVQITTPQNGNLTPSQMRDILLNKENV